MSVMLVSSNTKALLATLSKQANTRATQQVCTRHMSTTRTSGEGPVKSHTEANILSVICRQIHFFSHYQHWSSHLSLELQHHVVLRIQTHTRPEGVFKHGPLLGQGIYHRGAVRDQRGLGQVGQQHCHWVEAMQLLALLLELHHHHSHIQPDTG